MKIARTAVILLLIIMPVSGVACYPEGVGPEVTPTPTPTATPTEGESLPELRIHFIDVGQGDCILLDLGETEVLIDGGDRSPGVTAYLEDYVDGSLEIMVATHPHADHIGGLIAVMDAFEVEEIWHNGDTSTSKTYSDFIAAVNAEGAQVKEARRGDSIVVSGLTLAVLHPVEPLVGDTNNNSIVVMLSYGEVDFLFVGDAEEESEAGMIATGLLIDIEILKVGHHGSRSSSSDAFLDIIQPEIAIYMAEIGNSYGHPHAETISALQNIEAEVYGTDVCGTIIVMTDGKEYTIQAECTPTPTPTPIPSPTTIASASDVQIICIRYDGLVYRTESDEYVAIKNFGNARQDLAGWVLRDISEGYPSLTFPHYLLEPNETIRVYTNENHPEWGGFSFGYGKAIWNNTDPDWAALHDADGREVCRMSYPPSC